MNITVFGMGYVGCVTAEVFCANELGNLSKAMGIDSHKVQRD